MNVKIIDHTQNPIETIYRAYRVCYSASNPTEMKLPTLETAIGDVPDTQKMLKFINVHKKHLSPIEHCSFTFAIEGISRVNSHQLVRSRLASFSQQSQRYVKLEQFGYVIPPEIEKIPEAKERFLKAMTDDQDAYDTLYNLLKKNGRTKEQSAEDARYAFPNACKTNLIVTMNARELITFFGSRLCIRAQWEIRAMAEKMRKQVHEILPIFSRDDVMNCNKTCIDCHKDALGVAWKNGSPITIL